MLSLTRVLRSNVLRDARKAPSLCRLLHQSQVNSEMVPIVVESTNRGERAFDIFSRLLKERIICVHGPIDDAKASVVTAQLLFLEADAPTKPINIYINSPGGVRALFVVVLAKWNQLSFGPLSLSLSLSLSLTLSHSLSSRLAPLLPPRTGRHLWYGNLRHDAVRKLPDCHSVHGPGGIDGFSFAHGGHSGTPVGLLSCVRARTWPTSTKHRKFIRIHL